MELWVKFNFFNVFMQSYLVSVQGEHLVPIAHVPLASSLAAFPPNFPEE
jgi:hypothetical protein